MKERRRRNCVEKLKSQKIEKKIFLWILKGEQKVCLERREKRKKSWLSIDYYFIFYLLN
uniref:Uncharacterized protein n=1 Tax=Meloidogyne enterolobii TaxID=390850 RepID=A0A6V7VCG4_MELEN|nr:unnamed protein product [Meloidogyne enterolobii]